MMNITSSVRILMISNIFCKNINDTQYFFISMLNMSIIYVEELLEFENEINLKEDIYFILTFSIKLIKCSTAFANC